MVDAIVAARTAKGAFTSFSDFLNKVPLVVCNKRVIESLVKASAAFDSLGHPRKGSVLIHEQAIDTVIDVKRNEAMGQDSLFGPDTEAEATFEVPVPDGEWDKATLLGFEREMLGLYVSDHPLLGVEHILANGTDCTVAQLLSAADEAERAVAERGAAERGTRGGRGDSQPVTVGGILSGVQRSSHPAGQPWAAATLEDLEGAIEVLFSPPPTLRHPSHRRRDPAGEGLGRPAGGTPRAIAMEVSLPDLSASDSGPFCRVAPGAAVRARRGGAAPGERSHPGLAEVHLRLLNGRRTTVVSSTTSCG